jgi:hypothetical protein
VNISCRSIVVLRIIRCTNCINCCSTSLSSSCAVDVSLFDWLMIVLFIFLVMCNMLFDAVTREKEEYNKWLEEEGEEEEEVEQEEEIEGCCLTRHSVT